ncbi:unnamed protein product [Dicrocoelium dendriticum]|nr:unnamed protein product [Dicrocoelium dendriticum]
MWSISNADKELPSALLTIELTSQQHTDLGTGHQDPGLNSGWPPLAEEYYRELMHSEGMGWDGSYTVNSSILKAVAVLKIPC